MGAEQSQFSIYANGLAEVSRKCKWKKGLIVDVKNQEPLVVVDIQPINLGAKPNTLRVEERLDATAFIFTYSGDSIDIPLIESAPFYEITLKKLSEINPKIGGGRSSGKTTEIKELEETVNNSNDKINSLLLSLDDKRNFTVGSGEEDEIGKMHRVDKLNKIDKMLKSADGEPPIVLTADISVNEYGDVIEQGRKMLEFKDKDENEYKHKKISKKQRAADLDELNDLEDNIEDSGEEIEDN
ncbi:hypothetical protein PV-S19_0269 [Pacmanvirus S19]|nr:hypothetical protein PV-S19_0269 [Pacmanvirus S19]